MTRIDLRCNRLTGVNDADKQDELMMRHRAGCEPVGGVSVFWGPSVGSRLTRIIHESSSRNCPMCVRSRQAQRPALEADCTVRRSDGCEHGGRWWAVDGCSRRFHEYSGLGYPYHSRIDGTQEYQHHHDLYACSQQGWEGGQKPGRWPLSGITQSA